MRVRGVTERVWFGGAGIAKLLGRAVWWVGSDGWFRLTFGGSFVRNARFADFDMWVFEEISYETLVLEIWRVAFWGSLVRNARFRDLTRDFWRTSRTKRSFWRLDVWLLKEVSYETFVLQPRSVCPIRLSQIECPTRVSYNSVPQECPTRVSRKSVLQECHTRVSLKSVLQEYPARVSYKSVPQECPTRVSRKSVLQECSTRVSYKSVPQECPPRVSHKSVLQEFPIRVLHKSVS